MNLTRIVGMRILSLVTGYPSEADRVGGIFHRTACESLTRCGVEVEVVAPVPWVPPGLGRLMKKYGDYAATPKSYVLNGVKVHRPRYVQLPRGDWLGWSHRWYARLARRMAHAQPFDVLHAHYAYPCGLAAVNAGRALGLPVVLTLHGSDVNVFPNVSKRTRRLFRSAVMQADALVAVSQALVDRTRALTGRIPEVMPIGVDLQRFNMPSDKPTIRGRLRLPLDKFNILFVGNLIPAKGVRELLAALPLLESHNVVGIFVGQGPLQNDVAQTPNTVAVGPVSNERVAEYLAAADLLVLPSYSEGMPTVLVEAGAAGLPVLATAVGGIPELLAEERGYLVPSRSVDALVHGIADAMTNRENALRRAALLHQYVCEHYDADKNAAILIEIYQSLFKQRRGHRFEENEQTAST